MGVYALAVFGMTFFAALVALLLWQQRRARNRARMSRVLREFVAEENNENLGEPLSTVMQQG